MGIPYPPDIKTLAVIKALTDTSPRDKYELASIKLFIEPEEYLNKVFLEYDSKRDKIVYNNFYKKNNAHSFSFFDKDLLLKETKKHFLMCLK